MFSNNTIASVSKLVFLEDFNAAIIVASIFSFVLRRLFFKVDGKGCGLGGVGCVLILIFFSLVVSSTLFFVSLVSLVSFSS